MRITLFWLLVVIACPLGAEAILPEPFTSLLYARHDGAFYDRQAAEWKAIATGECATSEAWWHYYKTAQYSNRFGNGDHDLKAILAAATKQLPPDGFEMNYLRYFDDPDPVSRYAHLLAAHRLEPDRLEVATGLATYYTANGMDAERDAILGRMHAARALPAGVMEYNYNQLMSVAPGGILITHGDTDTYPSWILQSAYGVRPDVRVVCLPLLLGFPEYRRRELGDLPASPAPSSDLRTRALARIVKLERPVHFATTGNYFDELEQQNLYLTGLTFRYSDTPLDNLRTIAENYRSNWRLDHLRQPLDDSPAQAVADDLNQNYLPALFELHGYYQDNPAPEFREVTRLLQTIATRADVRDAVDAYLRGDQPAERIASDYPGLRAKDIQKRLVFIPAGTLKDPQGENDRSINAFSMQEAEVSNKEYQLFLEDLLRQRRFDLLDSVAIEQTDLAELLPAGVYEHVQQLHGDDPDFSLSSPNRPIVNVAHRAAELYARWLTEVYNNDPKRKDTRRVRFRLPTAEEWEYAARGGRNFAPYPWGGAYFANAKGCLLANFNTFLPVTETDVFGEAPYRFTYRRVGEDEMTEAEVRERIVRAQSLVDDGCEDWAGKAADGGVLTVHTDAYFPNDYGLYNIAGNAAEMLAEDGNIMGGSWLDPIAHMRVHKVIGRTLPHPSVGFRLVATYDD